MPNKVGVFRDGNLWTIVSKTRDGNLKVKARVKSVLIDLPHFTVSERGRNHYLESGIFVPSHAMIVGDVVEQKPDWAMLELLQYEPELMAAYHIQGEPDPVLHARFALCDDRGKVWAA